MLRAALGLLAALMMAGPALAHDPTPASPDGQAVLARLLEGNHRFAADQCLARPPVHDHRAALAHQQRPVAVVIGCADSRVPPELLFDQGLGDLFVIRVAGHVLSDEVIGSVEYAVEHLGTPLVIVLGHERCGAVAATVQGGKARGFLSSVLEPIAPAMALSRGQGSDRVDQTVTTNVLYTVTRLKACPPLLAERVKNHRLTIVGARYDLDTGLVDLIGDRLSLDLAP